MIPQFPQFKKIELSDKEDVEKFTHQYPPYSDFNFVSMWSWDIRDEVQISQLNGNLVVLFNDYLTDESFYSFLGNHKVNDTVKVLLDLSLKQNKNCQLKLLPEESIKNLNQELFIVEEDRDHFDYIFDVEKLSVYTGSDYAVKRTEVRRFLKKNEFIESRLIDISETKIKSDILRLNYDWLEHKKLKDPYFDIKNELIAIDRFLNSKYKGRSCNIGIFCQNSLIGYSVNELVSNDYAIGHFFKTNKHGSFEYLMKETSKYLSENNIKFLNFEQDLGINGLKKSKLSYRPVNFLKKYSITFKK